MLIREAKEATATKVPDVSRGRNRDAHVTYGFHDVFPWDADVQG